MRTYCIHIHIGSLFKSHSTSYAYWIVTQEADCPQVAPLSFSLSLSGWSRQRSATWWFRISTGNSWKPLQAWLVGVCHQNYYFAPAKLGHFYSESEEFLCRLRCSYRCILLLLSVHQCLSSQQPYKTLGSIRYRLNVNQFPDLQI